MPIDSLESLAEEEYVLRIREPSRFITKALMELGSATTEGVVASSVAAWHTAGYNGTGVRVAVIDGGFTDYSTLLGSDLPSSVGTYDWTGSGIEGSEHGTACAEIVHDMAPGASIDLHKINTKVELGMAVTQAITDGVDIISMSGGWSRDGPGDGTGYLASIVADARLNGIFYTTAAGNYAVETWAGTYVNYNDSHAWDGASTWFNFIGPSPGSCTYSFIPGIPLRADLHWDDRGAMDQDYNLHLYCWPLEGSIVYRVASSTNTQNGGAGQTPEEDISYITDDGENCYAWVVERVSSDRDVCLRLSAPGTGHLNYWTTSRSIGFPADSQDAITVGVVDVNSPYPLEYYSSQGPTFGTSGVCSGVQ